MINRNHRNVTATSAENQDSKGRQLSLAEVAPCEKDHMQLYRKYNLQKCPECNTNFNNLQTRLEEFEK
jgi:hypothetical protein